MSEENRKRNNLLKHILIRILIITIIFVLCHFAVVGDLNDSSGLGLIYSLILAIPSNGIFLVIDSIILYRKKLNNELIFNVTIIGLILTTIAVCFSLT